MWARGRCARAIALTDRGPGRIVPIMRRALGASIVVAVVAIVAPAAGSARQPAPAAPPRYPEMLRSAGVEGATRFRVRVSASGQPEVATFAVLETTHDLFSSSVKAALREWRWPSSAAPHDVTHEVRWRLLSDTVVPVPVCPRSSAGVTVVCATRVRTSSSTVGSAAVSSVQALPAGPKVRTPAEIGERLAQLERQRARWVATRPASYRYETSVSCFCITRYMGPWRVTVRHDSVTSVVAVNGAAAGLSPPLDTARRVRVEIDARFADAEAALRDTAIERVEIEYDERYGYPTRVLIDRRETVMDDEYTLFVRDFEALPAP